MRVAVMSDIHGFNIALDTVIADLAEQGHIDEVIVAGDLCEVGPEPEGVIQRLRQQEYTVLQGNTDRDAVAVARGGSGRRSLEYVVDQIGEEGVEYLARLPFSRRMTPPGGTSPDDDLLAVHANPQNLDEALNPNFRNEELRRIIGDTRAAVLVFGHIHICYTRRLGDMQLVDVSAVGNPKDEDLRCKYGLFNWDETNHRWDVELRKLPYPIEATTVQIRESDLPNPEKTLRKLLEASY